MYVLPKISVPSYYGYNEECSIVHPCHIIDDSQMLCPFHTVPMLIQVSFSTFDILTDDEVRQGLKTFSNWPTYPQVYVKVRLQVEG